MTKILNVIVGCECSGTIRRAIATLGHHVISVDIQPSDDGAPEYFGPASFSKIGWHHTGDLFEFLENYKASRLGVHGWFDLGIFHPECTYMTNSGWHWTKKPDSAVIPLKGQPRWDAMLEATDFYNRCHNLDIPHVATENPIMHGYAAARVGGKATQYVQPWMFGSKALKATGWRLRNLPKLKPTSGLRPPTDKRERATWAHVHNASPSLGREARSKLRSKTDPGMAAALASQWCGFTLNADLA